ncbi:hypothetical protein AAC387_Pa01g4105 [Persea americana]
MSTSSPFSLDHLPPSEQLCHVHCNFCDTVLAVSVPCSSLSKTVMVRCGHCTGLLSVNMRGLPLPAANQLSFNHSFLSASHNLLEETPTLPQSSLLNQSNPSETVMSTLRVDEPPKAPPINRQDKNKVSDLKAKEKGEEKFCPSAEEKSISDDDIKTIDMRGLAKELEYLNQVEAEEGFLKEQGVGKEKEEKKEEE